MRIGFLTCAVLLSMMFLPALAGAQETRPAAATQPAASTRPADPIEQTIREKLPALKDREPGLAAIKVLEGLRDPKVLNLFKHLDAGRLYERNGEVIVVYETKEKQQLVFNLFVSLDDYDYPTTPPLETLPERTLAYDTAFRPAPLVRRQVGNSLLALALKVNDPKIRQVAARDIGNRRVAAGLAPLRTATAEESNPAVRREMDVSIALLEANGLDPAGSVDGRVSAINKLAEMNSIRALSQLQDLAKDKQLDPKVAAALPGAIDGIESHIFITDWTKHIFFGLSAGSILVLLALGLAITFGLMGVINMAHGEMLMIGAVTTWATCQIVGPLLPEAYFDWYYVIAFPLAFLMAAAVGLLVEVTIVRHLYKRPLDSLLATIGVSYVLIQGVRLWKGDNLGLQRPSWANGSIEIMQDVTLPFNRLFLIFLAIFCVLLVVGIFRYTRLGLMVRATVQNREMAQALGVNTRLVDMFTFAFGAGLAGLAGYGIVLYDIPKPDMGQVYIVKTFLTVVVGGVGKLIGVIVSGLSIGFAEKLLEPVHIDLTQWISWLNIKFDATWSQVATLVLVVIFMQRRPGGLFPDKGRMADQADRTAATAGGKLSLKTETIMGLAMVVVGLVIIPLLYGSGHMSPEFVNKLGFIFAFTICAIGLDLIWGYIGVLSLCQFLFFTLGAYCMGLYLINHGPKADDGIPQALSVVMSEVGTRSPPWFLQYFSQFPVAVLLGLLLPGLVALIIGLTTFRSRVRGVYFSILTQAITVGGWLIFLRNDLKLGGTNGLTNFTHILGLPIAGNAEAGPFAQTRFWLYVVSFVVMMLAIVATRLLVNSGFGRVLVAIRDDETRLRFVGYQTWAYRAAAFTIAAVLAALGGMLYVPQKGIITPSDMEPVASILVVAWVAVGGRGTIWGAVFGAIGVSLMFDVLTSRAADYWLFVLGALFIFVPLLLPGGLMSLPSVIAKLLRPRTRPGGDFDVVTKPADLPAAGGH